MISTQEVIRAETIRQKLAGCGRMRVNLIGEGKNEPKVHHPRVSEKLEKQVRNNEVEFNCE